MKKQDKDIGITKIYLVTNCYDDPNKVYIGKTKNKGNVRHSNHKKTYGNNIIFAIIDEINSTDKKLWKPIETYWIHQFKQWGFEVMNINDGGGGPAVYTDDVKLKMRKPRNNFPKGQEHGLYGQKKTQEHINNMCTLDKGKKISESRTGKHYPKASQSQKNKKMPPKSKEEKYIIGIKHEKIVNQYDLKGNLINTYKSVKYAASVLGKLPGSISLVCSNKRKTAYGFIWKYKEI